MLANIEFFDNSKEAFPLWIPYRFIGGIPVGADPEQFRFMGALLDLDSPWFMLSVNLSFVLLITIYGISAYALARQLELARPAAALAAFILSTSGTTHVNFAGGRFYSLLLMTAGLFSFALYLRYIKHQEYWPRFAVAALWGACVSFGGYYALVNPIGMMFVFSIFLWWEKKGSFTPGLLKTFIDFTWMGVLAGLLWAVVIVPLSWYNFQVVAGEHHTTLGLPAPGTFINLFFPFREFDVQNVHGNVYSYISVIVLPGLVFFALQQKEERNRFLYPGLVLALGCLAILFSGFALTSWIYDFVHKLPVLTHIKHGTQFVYMLSLMLVFAACKGFEGIRPGLKWLLVSVAALLCLGAVLYHAPTTRVNSRVDEFPFFLDEVYQVFFVVLAVLGAYAVAFLLMGKRSVWIALAVVTVLSHVVFDTGFMEYRTPFSVRPERDIATALKADQGYHRVMCTKRTSVCPPYGSGRTFVTGGEAKYLSKENLKAYEIMLKHSLEDTTLRRPNHLLDEEFTCKSASQAFLQMSAVKYAICYEDDIPRGKWVEVARRVKGGKDVVLRKRLVDAPVVRLFDKWRVEEKLDGDVLETAKLWRSGKVIVDVKPAGLKQEKGELTYDARIVEFTEHRVVIEVETSKNSIVYTPDFYEKFWTASVNGSPVRVMNLYYAFRGVAVPAGKHTIIFKYEPVIFYRSLGVSLAAWASMLALLLLLARRNRRVASA